MLNNFPAHMHPMSQLVAAVSALNTESKFAKAYGEGIHKSKYWEVKRDEIYKKKRWEKMVKFGKKFMDL